MLDEHCKLNSECEKLIKLAVEKMNLSVRSFTRIKKVARTIADLEGLEQIQKQHLAEAIQYRKLDRIQF
jgi:magnesium chelatase family protein